MRAIESQCGATVVWGLCNYLVRSRNKRTHLVHIYFFSPLHWSKNDILTNMCHIYQIVKGNSKYNNFGGLFLLVKTFFFSGSLGNYPNHLPIAVYVLSTMNYIYSQAFMFSPLQELILYFRSISIQSGWSTMLRIWSARGVLCKWASTYTSWNYGRDKGSAAASLTRPVSQLLPF